MRITIFLCALLLSRCVFATDVTVVGYLKFANGLGRVTTALIDVLSKCADVGFIDTRSQFTTFEDIPEYVIKCAQEKKEIAPVSILTDNIWLPGLEPHKIVPDSLIKYAYTMCESTKIPKPWVDIINKKFDGIIVPDASLVAVYKQSGIKRPIFVISLPVYLEDFLNVPLKKSCHRPFVFGVSAALSKNKNIELLIRSFAEVFGNRHDVVLKIHSSWEGNLKEIKKVIENLKVKNITISVGNLSWKDYVNYIGSIDCYVLLSRGEGFSITVREAMAIGMPCIISNNTAHKTICKTGLVYGIASNIVKQSDREFYNVDVGNNFDCRQSDVCRALRHVKQHYDQYLKQADKQRRWVKQYQRDNLIPLYKSIISPKKVIQGKEDKITSDYVMTTSVQLHEKYKILRDISHRI